VIDQRFRGLVALLIIAAVSVATALAAGDTLPDNNVLMRALVDELDRAMSLQMGDLEKPYFIQYNVDDSIAYDLSAEYGALVRSDRNRSRRFGSQIRVGSYELDNTNFIGEGGFRGSSRGRGRGRGALQQSALPVDDDYLALRQSIWRAADRTYKSAVETLAQKRAYLKDRTIEGRPNDFSRAALAERVEPSALLDFDKTRWEENLQTISARFKDYPQVQDSDLRLLVRASNTYVVNSEGMRVRVADTVAQLRVNAGVQGEDGMRLSDSRTYFGNTTADFPPIDTILRDVDEMVAGLITVMEASPLEEYSGPVLFDDVAAAQVFQALLATGVAGRPDPVGEQRRRRRGVESLERKLGTRILPKSFQVWDDPTVDKHGDELLCGRYRYDYEGVPAERVDIVVNGKLTGICMSRVPTKSRSGSNGHARRSTAGGAFEAGIGCLFVKDDKGVSDEELKAKLIEAARDEGLEYGVRIKALKPAGPAISRAERLSRLMRAARGARGAVGGGLGDPLVAYKVYVADGREEPFRGCEFGPVDVSNLRRIVAAGDTFIVYNYVDSARGGPGVPSTILAPPVLFEELELSQIEQEHDKLPILNAPADR